MSEVPELPEIDFGGDVYRLGTLVPILPDTTTPLLSSAPGYTTWTRAEIEAAVKAKPVKRRQQFDGQAWIIDQKQRGSCNAAAAVAALRRAFALAGRDDNPALSWEFLYAQINGGRDAGSLLNDGMDALQAVGVPPLDLDRHPINRHILKRDYTPEDYRDAAKYKATACYRVTSEAELATLVLSGAGAAIVAVDVNNSFMSLDRNGICGGGGGVGNHAVCVDDVEIIDGELAFDMPNSWGLSFGQGGRAYLTWRRHFTRTVGNHQFYAVMAASNPGDGGPVVPA